MERSLLVSAVILFCSLSVSVFASDARIVGGELASIESRPYQVSLQDSSAGNARERHFCGGALIGDRWVLTAAHCLTHPRVTIDRVLVGTDTLYQGGVELGISRQFIHSDSDIALIELTRSAPAGLERLKLPDSTVLEMAANPGSLATVSGWGATLDATLDGGGGVTNYLRQVTVPLVSNAECRAVYGNSILDNMVCAGLAEGGLDSCQGDSGGPLTVDVHGTDYSIGVVSWGRGCAQPDAYGVYVRTGSFINWINTTMNPPPPPPPPPSCPLSGSTGTFQTSPTNPSLGAVCGRKNATTDCPYEVTRALTRGSFPLLEYICL